MKRFVNVDDLEDLARGTDEYYTILGIIGNPLAEKINIVQCKDCAFSSVRTELVFYPEKRFIPYVHCSRYQTGVDDEWFCAGGVSRNG